MIVTMNKQLIALFLFGLACGFQPPAVRTTVGVVSSNKRASVAMSLFGDNKQKEAEEKARIEAEQEALNARYAKESQNDLVSELVRRM